VALHAGAGRGPGHLDPLSRQGGGSAPTTAFAHLGVSFTQDFSLEWPAGSIADSPHVLASIKLRGNGSALNQLIDDNRGLLNKVLFGSDTLDVSHDAEHPQGFLTVIDNSAGNNGGGVVRAALGDTNVATNNGFLAAFAPLAAHARNMEYFNLTVAAGVDHANGQKLGAMAIDGVQVALFADGGTWGSGSIANSVGKFMINVWKLGQQGAADFDLARLYFDTPASLADILDPTPANGFAADFLAKEFIAGVGSVDIGADGSLWTGLSPKVFHEVRPGGVAADILTNRSTAAGSPGNPVVSAYSKTSNAAIKAPFPASNHPNETGEQPYSAWLPTAAFSSFPDNGSFAPSNNGQEIRLGDLICIWFAGAGGVGPRAGLSCSSTNGGTWTRLAGTTTGDDFSIWGRTAALSDVTPNGQSWNVATRPTITWTPGGGFTSGGSNVTAGAFVIRKPSGNPITVTGATPVKMTPAIANPWLAAATTPSSAPALLVDFIKSYGWQYAGLLTPAGGMIPRFKRGDDAANVGHSLGSAWPWMMERRLLTTAPVSARSYATNTDGDNPGVLISLVFS
jgi:hypothetical protein